ncbi:tripartite tricarboxylate transporter TctB family protein [Marispirochaeta aestuarii]|uniref:tripartite tricarboxylate transporter TctB family protein n=1 Tax=Marispirochaeta aestuarii TaxID=1963862 RepID=UPI0029C63B72|nr:tripartite tricarboxylate transporter TctB family protein [Marispirochaeta aestuarii]
MKNIILGLVCLLFVLVFFTATLQLPSSEASHKDPAVYPSLLLFLIALVGVILIVQGFLSYRRDGRKKIFDYGQIKLPLILMILTLVYVMVMQFLGFLISTFIYLFLVFMTFGGEKKAGFWFSSILTCIEYGLFAWILRVRLPEPLFSLLGSLL